VGQGWTDPEDPATLERQRRLAGELDEARAAALLVVARSAHDPDLAPFVGPVHLGQAVLLAPRHGAPKLGYFTPMEREEAARSGLDTVAPEALELDRLSRERPRPGMFLAGAVEGMLAAAGIGPGRIALAGHGPAGTLREAWRELEGKGWHAVDGNEIVRRITQRKTAAELGAVEDAARGAAAAFRRVAELLAEAVARDGELWLAGERLRVGRLREEIAVVLARFGLSQPEGNIVAAGEEGAVPHSQGDSQRVLRAGESLVVDLYPRGELFADCTRTFCVGQAPEPLLAAHAAALAALEGAEAGARPGVRGFALQEAACALFAARGYATPITHPGTTTGYVHGLGHGVGYELHEFPSFRKQAGAEGVLGAGDVVTLEPGLYDPQAGWAVRIEDLYLLETAGPRSLTPLPRQLDPRAWR
jgi:Xaa-Pro aminopeptidase